MRREICAIERSGAVIAPSQKMKSYFRGAESRGKLRL